LQLFEYHNFGYCDHIAPSSTTNSAMASKSSQPPKPGPEPDTERNQYIPSFIANKPFYVPADTGADYLEHQRLQRVESDSLASSKWYDRGTKRGPAATKYRKGACENCGAMTHKAKDCLQRARKQGARWSGKDIVADEVVSEVRLGWDAKRDRWNGYDAGEYEKVVEGFNEMEKLRKKAAGEIEEGEGDGEGDRYEEETDMGRKQSTSTRNLRLREDTAKYLLNLDLESAKYDPKTRTMVDSGATADQAAALVAEEGFVKKSGDAAEFDRAQRYAWETQERDAGTKLHLQANPTAGEIVIKKEKKELNEQKAAHRKALLDKYGGQEHLSKAPLKDALVTESERFVEYDESGRIKGAPKVIPKSKYAEDVFIKNHTSVWGSWWANFEWGYACCHSTIKMSYCTGEEGKRALEDEQNRKKGIEMGDDEDTTAEQQPTESPRSPKGLPSLSSKQADTSKRKRAVEETRDGVTESDMDEFRRKRANATDPMAKMLGKVEI